MSSQGQLIPFPGQQRTPRWFEPPSVYDTIPATVQDIEWARHRLIWDGDCRALVDIYRKYIRVNDELRSAVGQRISGLDSRPVVMRTNKANEGNAEAEAIAVELQAQWDGLDNRHQVIKHLVRGALTHSFAPAEITWTSTMSGFELTAIDPISQKAMIVATVNNRGRLNNAIPGSWFLRRSQSLGDAEAIIDDKWIVGVPDAAEPLADQSLMATSIYSGIFGQRILGSWTVYVDRYGVPFLHVQVGDYEDRQMIETAKQVIKRAGEDHGVISSTNDELTINVVDGSQVARSGTTDVQGRYLDASRQRIDRVWVGGSLVMGTGAGGAYNQGAIHQDAYFALLQGDARYVEHTLQRQLVGAFMRLNRLDMRMQPQATLRVRLESPGVVADLASRLGQVGYSMDTSELSETLGYTVTGGPV